MPYRKVAGVLTDVGTEEVGHFEMVAAIVHQLTKNMTMEQIEEAGFQDYFVDVYKRQGLKDALEEVKPAHIPIIFIAIYLYVRDVNTMTIKELQSHKIGDFAF